MNVLIALRELLLPALSFSRVVVEGRSRALVLTDSPGSWGSSRRFVAHMVDPGMVPSLCASAAPHDVRRHCSRIIPPPDEVAYFRSLKHPHHPFSRRGDMLQLKEEATQSTMCSSCRVSHPSSCDFNTAFEAYRFEPIEAFVILFLIQSDSQNVVQLKISRSEIWLKPSHRRKSCVVLFLEAA